MTPVIDLDDKDWREQLEAAEETGYLADLPGAILANLQRQVDSLERHQRGAWPRDPFSEQAEAALGDADDYWEAEGLRRVAYPIEERRERDTRWLYASQLSPVEVWLQRALLGGALAVVIRLLVWAI